MKTQMEALFKLKVYIEEIKEVKNMTDEEWLTAYAIHPDKANIPYMSRKMWLGYLEQCAIKEAENLWYKAA